MALPPDYFCFVSTSSSSPSLPVPSSLKSVSWAIEWLGFVKFELLLYPETYHSTILHIHQPGQLVPDACPSQPRCPL